MLTPPALSADCSAGVIARFLKARGIDRVFGLCGGHVMPIWMRLDAEGIAHRRRARRARRRLHGARLRRTDRRRRRGAGHRRSRRDQRDDRHRQCACREGAGARAVGHAAAAAGKSRRVAGPGAHRPRASDHALCAHRARAGPRTCRTRRGVRLRRGPRRRTGAGLPRLSDRYAARGSARRAAVARALHGEAAARAAPRRSRRCDGGGTPVVGEASAGDQPGAARAAHVPS